MKQNPAGQSERLWKNGAAAWWPSSPQGNGYRPSRDALKTLQKIAPDFSDIPVKRCPKVKVGVVGEIYVKYSRLGNNNLEEFLARNRAAR